MCDVSRRDFLVPGSAFLSLAAEAELLAGPKPERMAEAAKVDLVAPDVYFHEGDISNTADAVCNDGWIMFEDYVPVIDANFPAGARLIISKIRALTDKPIRFAFDTHHHGDHAYGNQVFVENGGVPVAHTGAIEETKRHVTGYYAHEPGGWEAATKDRADLKTSGFSLCTGRSQGGDLRRITASLGSAIGSTRTSSPEMAGTLDLLTT